jgi:hypothetical protein
MDLKNYVIDGDVEGIIESDFFSQLKSMLTSQNSCDVNTNSVIEDEDSCCLLTKEPLKTIHIVLECGHKFNYVPLYREIVAQKTKCLYSSNGYYNSYPLKSNQIKCPYCRNVQDKLLPYLQYDGVKKMFYVNHPAKMSMTSQPCMYYANSSKNINSKIKKTIVCKECAIDVYNGTYVCKKHYDLSLSTPSDTTDTTTSASLLPTVSSSPSKCGVILRYGKNKGKPCSNPSSCRVHTFVV